MAVRTAAAPPLLPERDFRGTLAEVWQQGRARHSRKKSTTQRERRKPMCQASFCFKEGTRINKRKQLSRQTVHKDIKELSGWQQVYSTLGIQASRWAGSGPGWKLGAGL